MSKNNQDDSSEKEKSKVPDSPDITTSVTDKPTGPDTPQPDTPLANASAVDTPPPKENPDTKYYKHSFMNCHLSPIQGAVVILRKGMEDKWGFYFTDNKQVQKYIEGLSFFGKNILPSSQKEFEAATMKGKPAKKYTTGPLTGIK